MIEDEPICLEGVSEHSSQSTRKWRGNSVLSFEPTNWCPDVLYVRELLRWLAHHDQFHFALNNALNESVWIVRCGFSRLVLCIYTVSTDIWLVTVEYFEEYKSLPNQTGLHEILFNLGANASYFSALSGDFPTNKAIHFLTYRARKNGSYVVVWWNSFLLFLNSSAWPCLGP